MKNPKFKLIGLEGDDTQFRIEIHTPGLWHETENEVRIRRQFKGRPSRYGPSFPESTLDDLIATLIEARDDLRQMKDQG